MSICTVGYLFYDEEKNRVVHEKGDELGAIAGLKVDQIVQWRQERLKDGKIIHEDPFISSGIRELLFDRASLGLEEEILFWMKSLQETGYENVFLLDSAYEARLSFPEGRYSYNHDKTRLAEIAATGKVTLSDFHRNEESGDIYIDLFIPMKDTPSGILILEVDPKKYRYPLIQS